MSNINFKVHCASNNSNIIGEYNIKTIKNELGEKIMFETLLSSLIKPYETSWSKSKLLRRIMHKMTGTDWLGVKLSVKANITG